MKYLAAGITAIVLFFISGALVNSIETVYPVLIDRRSLELLIGNRWFQAAAAVVVTVSIIAMIVRVRTNAAMKWRKSLAARARA